VLDGLAEGQVAFGVDIGASEAPPVEPVLTESVVHTDAAAKADVAEAEAEAAAAEPTLETAGDAPTEG
jgi:hypothetical protein